MPDEAEQLYAEGGSEPAARAEESMPEPAPAVEPEPAPPSPQVEPGLLPEPEPVLPAEPQQVEPVPPPALKKRSRKKTTGGGAQTRRAIAVLNRIFPEITIYRDRYPDENEMTWLDVWDMFCEEYRATRRSANRNTSVHHSRLSDARWGERNKPLLPNLPKLPTFPDLSFLGLGALSLRINAPALAALVQAE